ncbi:hypothetical protein MKX07_008105 [Trichoderma sp. CBMAI-0711]|nr:hypothetical protein MKX07_008105 [Trichoderma sp. CBMAI-0711]
MPVTTILQHRREMDRLAQPDLDTPMPDHDQGLARCASFHLRVSEQTAPRTYNSIYTPPASQSSAQTSPLEYSGKHAPYANHHTGYPTPGEWDAVRAYPNAPNAVEADSRPRENATAPGPQAPSATTSNQPQQAPGWQHANPQPTTALRPARYTSNDGYIFTTPSTGRNGPAIGGAFISGNNATECRNTTSNGSSAATCHLAVCLATAACLCTASGGFPANRCCTSSNHPTVIGDFTVHDSFKLTSPSMASRAVANNNNHCTPTCVPAACYIPTANNIPDDDDLRRRRASTAAGD